MRFSCAASMVLGDDMGLGKSMQSIIAALESGAKKY
jgi:SNF2 family DNA or RNA helicase